MFLHNMYRVSETWHQPLCSIGWKLLYLLSTYYFPLVNSLFIISTSWDNRKFSVSSYSFPTKTLTTTPCRPKIIHHKGHLTRRLLKLRTPSLDINTTLCVTYSVTPTWRKSLLYHLYNLLFTTLVMERCTHGGWPPTCIKVPWWVNINDVTVVSYTFLRNSSPGLFHPEHRCRYQQLYTRDLVSSSS